MFNPNRYFILGIIIVSSCGVPKELEVVQGVKYSDQSIIYALPQTTLELSIETTKTIVKKGVYAEYADKYLRIKHVPQEDSQTWAITDTKIETRTEADPSGYYTLLYKTYPDNLA